MTPRSFPLFNLLFVVVLALTGCKQDELVTSTTDELSKLATEIADTVNDAEDKKQGVADAQKLLDGKKDDLKAKMTEIGDLRGFQVSDEAMTAMGTSRGEAARKVEGLKHDLISEAMKDPELKKALDKLTRDFTETINP